MISHKDMNDFSSENGRPARVKGGSLANKSSRMKQWLAGTSLPLAIRNSLLKGLKIDYESTVIWFDRTFFDDSLIETVMNRPRGENDPQEAVISPIYLDLDMDMPFKTLRTNLKKNVVRSVRQKMIKGGYCGQILIPGFKMLGGDIAASKRGPCPTFSVEDYKALFPAASNQLQLNAKWLADSRATLTDPAAIAYLDKVVEEHEAIWNKAGGRYDPASNKRQADAEAEEPKPAKVAKTISKASGDPEDPAALKKLKKSKVFEWDYIQSDGYKGKHMVTSDGDQGAFPTGRGCQ